jgi:hypothetical protein
MIERKCPTCEGRAAITVFVNEFGQFAKLWKCERCSAVWGVPVWDYIARDNPHAYGLEPWTEHEIDKNLIAKRTDQTPHFWMLPGFAKRQTLRPLRLQSWS